MSDRLNSCHNRQILCQKDFSKFTGFSLHNNWKQDTKTWISSRNLSFFFFWVNFFKMRSFNFWYKIKVGDFHGRDKSCTKFSSFCLKVFSLEKTLSLEKPLCFCLFSYLLPLFSAGKMAAAHQISSVLNGNQEIALNILKSPDQPTNNNNYNNNTSDNRHQKPPPSSSKIGQDCCSSAACNLSVSFIQKVIPPLPCPFFHFYFLFFFLNGLLGYSNVRWRLVFCLHSESL